MTERFTTIFIGNSYECVIKDHLTGNTCGMFNSDVKAVKEVVKLLNEHEKTIKRDNNKITELHWENHQLTTRIETIKNTIEEAYQTERTELGRSVLKQLLEKIQ